MAVPTSEPNLLYVDLDGEHAFAIKGDVATIGRSPDQNLVLKEAFVSRRHALMANEYRELL
jgi:pSer/pThr/pTyr-binding forkhead associated (FHA) protein